MHCPLFVELCAGTAALSLRLHKDGAKPPVSRMGAKTGYADRILTLLGLVPGQGADAYLWCEPDPGVRLLLHAYRDATLARGAAAIIRGWAAEDPRALWERLRAEGPPRLPEGEVNSAPSGLPATIAPDARQIDPREVARLCTLMRWAYCNMPIGHNGKHFTHVARGPDATVHFGANNFGDTTSAANGLDRLPEMPATIAPDARQIDPHEVAREVVTGQWAYRRGPPESGFAESRTGGGSGDGHGDTADMLAAKLAQAPVMPEAAIAPDARQIDPPALPEGTVAYMDPPYVGTTGYAHDLPRAEVVALARRWAAAGATVAISEAEPIPELVAEGWFAVEITDSRKGHTRTFSKQQREFLTMNREPVEAVGPVFDLFGG